MATKTHEIDGLVFHELASAEQLENAVGQLAQKISSDYAPDEKIVVLTVMEGARYFADALLDALADARFEQVEIKASSYNGAMASSGMVRFEGLMQLNLLGCNVLIVDDVYDTGTTLANLIFKITGFCPKTVKVAVMFEKERDHDRKVNVDHVGMVVPDVFLVGYGMDYKEKYRELPFLAMLDQK